ncbi:hypothetical protein CSAL01_10745 [Colletotrichum salicis]|uniref:C6 zinc finger protein n=1 Tax=Colletotrichum salicis TaxID=1209931 RepID=A0A135V5V5_9PEZI|nr:hypothetical protein CSAL01_10745 [Colletotrichum salicis]
MTWPKCTTQKPCLANGVKRSGQDALFASTTAKEGRALQYFYETAEPAMSGTLDPYFWMHLVMQLGTNEPAFKHALVAISFLFEQADGSQEDITAGQRLVHQRQGLHHYNAAIRELKTKDLKEKPADSDSLIDDSASFVFNKTLQSHSWCSMPWGIEIG